MFDFQAPVHDDGKSRRACLRRTGFMDDAELQPQRFADRAASAASAGTTLGSRKTSTMSAATVGGRTLAQYFLARVHGMTR
jgi:hypothetical protein